MFRPGFGASGRPGNVRSFGHARVYSVTPTARSATPTQDEAMRPTFPKKLRQGPAPKIDICIPMHGQQ